MASTIKVDNVQNQPGTNIVNKCGTTITLGASGDTVSLASGASQSGFGRTGTVDWQTSSIKTSTFTATNGEGYFANTSGGAFTMNLPAGSAGNIVSVVDYTNTFQNNNLTVSPNGSDKIGGVAEDAVLAVEGQSVTFVYVDSTEGWKNIQDSTSNVIGNQYITATGGTVSTSGNCKIHVFTGPGTFCVSSVHPCAANNAASYMVIAGGGGGGDGGTTEAGSGGGAGGYRETKNPISPYTASPLCGYPTPGNRITLTATGYPITVGGGGGPGCSSPGGGNTPGVNGSNSSFSTITSTGGGGGTSGGASAGHGGTGGSGGGGNGRCGPGTPGNMTGRSGNTPPVSPPQGNNGGNGLPAPANYSGGGGGGATAVGGNASAPNNDGGAGGTGATTNISGSSVGYAGGGGGGTRCNSGNPSPATQGGGAGGTGNGTTAPNGTANRGGGAGGTGGPNTNGGTGGSGIVIIRYKFQ